MKTLNPLLELDPSTFKAWSKKPIVVHAVRWMGEPVLIPTLEGAHICSTGDWIVMGAAGEFYPVKPHIFVMTYEMAYPENVPDKEKT